METQRIPIRSLGGTIRITGIMSNHNTASYYYSLYDAHNWHHGHQHFLVVATRGVVAVVAGLHAGLLRCLCSACEELSHCFPKRFPVAAVLPGWHEFRLALASLLTTGCAHKACQHIEEKNPETTMVSQPEVQDLDGSVAVLRSKAFGRGI